MKHEFQMFKKIILFASIACIIFFGYLYINNDIGVQKSKLEDDIRSSQKINDNWTINGHVSDTIAAYISYPEDKFDHTFSIYINRPGLSFGYFFRGGGSLSEVEKYVVEFTIEGYDERAFISMNEQNIDRLEINDGNSVQVIDVDSNKPFTIVLPTNAGAITFYNIEGKSVEFWKHSL